MPVGKREANGGRIRDKIAASKAKGMWMNGSLPRGQDVQSRLLVVDEAEAADSDAKKAPLRALSCEFAEA